MTPPREKCAACDGEGTVLAMRDGEAVDVTCTRCNGTGEVAGLRRTRITTTTEEP